jgi:hypothetical protein
MNERMKEMEVDAEPLSEPFRDSRAVDRLYGQDSVNPAQSSDTPWLRDPEYFSRYDVGCMYSWRHK